MNRVELYFTRWFIICNAIYIDPSFLVWKFHADRYLLPLENRRALVFNMLFASNAEILMVYSICSIATARGILFYKSSIWKLNVEYGFDSHFGMVKELKSLFYAFVFQLCSKSCSRSFCSTFLQQLNFDILISWIRSFFASVFRKTNFHDVYSTNF